MNLQPRFHTEAREYPSYTSIHPSKTGKLIPSSLSDCDFLKKEPQQVFKYLTIKVHEARLLVDVSVFGKMTTLSKFQIGSLSWKTSVDKESHMNPKWNESKTFEIRNLCKYLKTLEPFCDKGCSLEDLNKKTSSKKSDNNDPGIIIGIYDHSFLRDTLIGETRVSLVELMKKPISSNWFIIRSKEEPVGSIFLTLKFEASEDELSTNFTQGEPTGYGSKFSSSEYKNPQDIYNNNRVHTEPHDSTKFNMSGRTNFSNYKNATPSQYISSRENLQNPSSYQRIHSNSGYRFSELPSTHKQKPNQRLKTAGDDGFTLYRRPPSFLPSKQKLEEREYETLITYENNYEEENDVATPADEKKFYDNFFNSRSSDERKSDVEKDDSDGTDCDIASEEGDEGDRVTKEDELSSDATEAKGLENVVLRIKKENFEVRSKEAELKNKMEALQLEFDKKAKERETLESKKNDLNLREECLRNERKNLSVDFNHLKKQGIDFQDHQEALNELQNVLMETKVEEMKEKERTEHLEGEIKNLAVFYQRETKGLKHLEHEMYKKLIAEKIREYGIEFDDNQIIRQSSVINQGILNNKGDNNVQEGENMNEYLGQIYDRQYELDLELQSRVRNIERLRMILTDGNEEFRQHQDY